MQREKDGERVQVLYWIADSLGVDRGECGADCDGTTYADPPTGYIEFDGEPMAYWLPAGVTAADIGVQS